MAEASVKGHARSPIAAVAIWRWRAQGARARSPTAIAIPSPASTTLARAPSVQATAPPPSRCAARRQATVQAGTKSAQRPTRTLTVAGRARARGGGTRRGSVALTRGRQPAGPWHDRIGDRAQREVRVGRPGRPGRGAQVEVLRGDDHRLADLGEQRHLHVAQPQGVARLQTGPSRPGGRSGRCRWRCPRRGRRRPPGPSSTTAWRREHFESLRTTSQAGSRPRTQTLPGSSTWWVVPPR